MSMGIRQVVLNSDSWFLPAETVTVHVCTQETSAEVFSEMFPWLVKLKRTLVGRWVE